MLGMSTHGTRPITLVEPFLHILRRQLQLAELNPQRERRPHFDPFSVRLFLLLVFPFLFPRSFPPDSFCLPAFAGGQSRLVDVLLVRGPGA